MDDIDRQQRRDERETDSKVKTLIAALSTVKARMASGIPGPDPGVRPRLLPLPSVSCCVALGCLVLGGS